MAFLIFAWVTQCKMWTIGWGGTVQLASQKQLGQVSMWPKIKGVI